MDDEAEEAARKADGVPEQVPAEEHPVWTLSHGEGVERLFESGMLGGAIGMLPAHRL